MRCPSVVPREAVRLPRERTGPGSGAGRLASSGSVDYKAVGERERREVGEKTASEEDKKRPDSDPLSNAGRDLNAETRRHPPFGKETPRTRTTVCWGRSPAAGHGQQTRTLQTSPCNQGVLQGHLRALTPRHQSHGGTPGARGAACHVLAGGQGSAPQHQLGTPRPHTQDWAGWGSHDVHRTRRAGTTRRVSWDQLFVLWT